MKEKVLYYVDIQYIIEYLTQIKRLFVFLTGKKIAYNLSQTIKPISC